MKKYVLEHWTPDLQRHGEAPAAFRASVVALLALRAKQDAGCAQLRRLPNELVCETFGFLETKILESKRDVFEMLVELCRLLDYLRSHSADNEANDRALKEEIQRCILSKAFPVNNPGFNASALSGHQLICDKFLVCLIQPLAAAAQFATAAVEEYRDLATYLRLLADASETSLGGLCASIRVWNDPAFAPAVYIEFLVEGMSEYCEVRASELGFRRC